MIKNNQDKKSTYYTHGFHPYPAKFTPQLVNKFFQRYCKVGDRILDPFCGSGTTLVEGIINGMESYGIDLNPIAFIISKAKTNLYSANDINIIKDILNEINQINYQDNINKAVIPNFKNRDHWFQENVSKELSILKNFIKNIDESNVKDLFLCAFSKIIVKVSNQDSEVRYCAKKKNHLDGIVFSEFNSTINSYIALLSKNEIKVNSSAKIFNGDSIRILEKLENDFFDFIITSPPYINTFDYYLYHKLRMFWLDYDHIPIRKKEIGNHHRIDSQKIEIAKSEYIISMKEIMDELSRVSKLHSKLVMIIGDGIVNGNIIDMSLVIDDICKVSNYKIIDIESTKLSETTRSFNKSFSNANKKEHNIVLINNK
ncbi:MAG: DNA methyltransferase [Bacteroidales bacterium]|jgi:site-specific DNA-methyltransferase (cytosine-N4-specific)